MNYQTKLYESDNMHNLNSGIKSEVEIKTEPSESAAEYLFIESGLTYESRNQQEQCDESVDVNNIKHLNLMKTEEKECKIDIEEVIAEESFADSTDLVQSKHNRSVNNDFNGISPHSENNIGMHATSEPSSLRLSQSKHSSTKEIEVIDVDQLISLVFERAALWDKRLKICTSRSTLANGWREIATTMKIEELKLRKKWKYLRDQFSIELSKIKPPRPGDAAETEGPKWCYFKQLLFLKDVVPQRPFSGNLNIRRTQEIRVGQPRVEHQEEEASQRMTELNCSEVFENNPPNTIGDTNVHEERDRTDIDVTHNTKNAPTSFFKDTAATYTGYGRKRTQQQYVPDSLRDTERRKLTVYQESAKREREMDNDDDDLLFLKSLLPHINKIPDNRKLSFRNRVQEIVEQFAYSSSISNAFSSSSIPPSD